LALQRLKILGKISNKKNYFENDESFLVLYSKYRKRPLYTSICRKENDKI